MMTRVEILRALKANVVTVERAKELLAQVGDEAASASGADRRIAIISMAGRFPHAKDVDAFWANLVAGRDCIEEVPPSRWDARADAGGRDTPGASAGRWGGFIDDVDVFDPGFFRISPREAQLLDPQERLLLQSVWTLLERIGYTRRAIAERFDGKVGVYAASMYHQYHSFEADLPIKAAISLSSHASIANRISNFFGFTGPSIAVDTMCSGAGTALHLACQSLLVGDSALAVVGAVNLSIHPYKYLALRQASLLASGKEARAFADGDGFIPGEAVGAVLLKRLDRALHDEDPIAAVISSTAINHKGQSDGFNVPTVGSIRQLIEDHHTRAGLAPSAISYVECAATGAPLADASEMEALQGAYASVARDRTIRIGSVKSNIGHPEAAAGLCQLIKVALALQHGTLVPTLGSEPLNPKITLDGGPFRVQRVAEPWPVEAGAPRRAAVQTLGAGGSNCHVLLEEHAAAARPAARSSVEPQLLVFSARTKERLVALVSALADHVAQQPEVALDAVAYTLQLGREEMTARAALVVDRASSLVNRLQDCLRVLAGGAVAAGQPPVFFHDLGAAGPIGAEDSLSAALAARDLDVIARRWTQGAEVPWQDLHRSGGAQARRAFVSLPTYPFAQVRCWLPAPTEPSRPVAAPQPQLTPVGAAEPPPEAQPASAAEPGEVRAVVVAEIGKLTGLEPGSFHDRQSLVELGLNSVMRLLLATSLCRALPFLSESRDGARLVACKSVEELIASIKVLGNGGAEPEEPPQESYSFRCGSSEFSALDPHALEGGAVVIGAGPAGLMAALTLRANGVSPVAVVDKRPTINRMQMITLYQHTLPYLQRMGLLDRIVARAPLIRHHDFYLNRNGQRRKYYSKGMDPSLLGRVAPGMDYSKERINDHFVGESVLAISLADLQQVLLEAAEEAQITVVPDVDASLERAPSAKGFRVRLAHVAADGDGLVVEPRMIVLADGLRSANAMAAGVTYVDLPSPRDTEHWYVFHCKTDRRQSCLCYEFSFDDRDELIDCAFGLFYPQRSEFGVALYRATPEPPSLDFLKEKAAFFAASQGATFEGIKWRTQRIDSRLTAASVLAVDNVVLTGDAAGTGSPNAGLGAVLAISAYGWGLEQYCRLAQRSRQEAIAFYNDTAREYALNWQNRSRYIWSRISDLVNITGAPASAVEGLRG